MMPPKQILIGGGVRSGKSAFAVSLARQLGARRAFIATARAIDDEMRDRIAQHRQTRGTDFVTVEAPVDLVGALRALAAVDVVVIDCLTVWLANALVEGSDASTIALRVDELAAVLPALSFHSLVVTNEVGMGVHPDSALGRTFRDVVGRAHQRLAHQADEIYFAALGVMLRLHPGPVVVQSLMSR